MRAFEGSYDPDAQVPVETVRFQLEQLAGQYAIHYGLLEACGNLSIEVVVRDHMQALVVDIRAKIPFRDGNAARIPADWWEAVKERWAPAWALRRWPVRYRFLVPRAYYPGLRLPREHGPEFVMFRPEPIRRPW